MVHCTVRMFVLLMLLVTLASGGTPKTEERVPVLLELFTSERYWSCPPADRLLAPVERRVLAKIIARAGASSSLKVPNGYQRVEVQP